MKKLLKALLAIVIVLAIIYFVPKLVHKCDGCETWFFGPGYEANAIADLVTDDNQTLCRDCAEVHHKLEIALGKSIEEYQKDIFDLDDFLSKFE